MSLFQFTDEETEPVFSDEINITPIVTGPPEEDNQLEEPEEDSDFIEEEDDDFDFDSLTDELMEGDDE